MNWFEFHFIILRVIMRYKIKKKKKKKNIGLKRIFFLILSPLLINLTYRCQLKKYCQGNEGKKLYYKVIKILFIFHFFGIIIFQIFFSLFFFYESLD